MIDRLYNGATPADLAAQSGVTIFDGDVGEIAGYLGEDYFDACLTDPPYGLGFMGQKWDHGVPGPDVWREVLRVLKPGATMPAFGGTRTHHRLMGAIEDAGFEIRDCLMWLYGSGFPKSLDIGKALDKVAGAERQLGPKRVSADGTVAHSGAGKRHEGYERPWREDPEAVDRNTRTSYPATDAAKTWDGWGTALKPAWEPIVLAMKPCEGTFAENALKWGVAGLNVAACRISTLDNLNGGAYAQAGGRTVLPGDERVGDALGMLQPGKTVGKDFEQPTGRWPANLLLDEEAAAQLDAQSGITKSTGGKNTPQYERELRMGCTSGQGANAGGLGDMGGASRFYYVAKASRSERGDGNTHPTVKPLKLCEYLARLLLPPARPDSPRRILVPFSGSGSEIIGALRAGWDEVVGIEIDPAYTQMAYNRIAAALEVPK